MFFPWERVKSLLIMTSKGETAPCIVFSFLITVSTGGLWPRPLTSSAGAPLRDLVIQFLTVDSENLPRAPLTSWTHWEKVASFLGGGTTPLKVEILRASPWVFTANLWMSSIILMNLAFPLGSSGLGHGGHTSSSSSFLLASATSSWVATLHSTVTFWPTHHSMAAIERMWVSISADSFSSSTASHSLNIMMLRGTSGLSLVRGPTICWEINIPAITSFANKAVEKIHTISTLYFKVQKLMGRGNSIICRSRGGVSLFPGSVGPSISALL